MSSCVIISLQKYISLLNDSFWYTITNRISQYKYIIVCVNGTSFVAFILVGLCTRSLGCQWTSRKVYIVTGEHD